MSKILVTGGTSGLGKAIAVKLATSGHEVFVTYCSSEKSARDLAEIHKIGTVHCDFRQAESLENLLVAIQEMQPDVLINNALTGLSEQYFHKLGIENLSQNFMQNVVPVLKITQAALQVFRKRKSGKIITILSSALLNKPPIGWSEYTAEKAYLLSMSKSWAVENARHNIVSNCVSPSFMATPLNKNTDERVIENMILNSPLKKLLTIEEVADCVHFLATASNHINGTNLIINTAENVI